MQTPPGGGGEPRRGAGTDGDQGDLSVEGLVHEHGAAVHRIVAGIVGESEAEDAAQEVFVAVQRGLAKFRREARASTWLYRIAVNVGLKRLRRRRRWSWLRPLGDEEPAAQGPGPGAALAAEERRALVHRALEQLPEHQRAVVVLRAFEGLSFAEVARVLEIQTETAESRMARAKVRLRELLGPWLDEAGGSE